MIDLVLYFLFGYFVIQYEKPVHFAGGYAVAACLLWLIFGEKLLSVLFFGAILFAYTAFVYMVVDRYGDRVLAPTTASKVEHVLQ
jgi:hypothetical protein